MRLKLFRSRPGVIANSGEPGLSDETSHCAAFCEFCFREAKFLRRFLLVPLGDQLIGTAEHGTRARAVSLANQAFTLHLIEHGGGAAVADAQAALQDGSRG